MKIHVLAITIKRAKSSQQRYIRETVEKLVVDAAAQKNFVELVEDIIGGKLASYVYHETKKIYPLKRVEVIKTKVIDEKKS
jgi:small subunit ribosomal protein S3Ae